MKKLLVVAAIVLSAAIGAPAQNEGKVQIVQRGVCGLNSVGTNVVLVNTKPAKATVLLRQAVNGVGGNLTVTVLGHQEHVLGCSVQGTLKWEWTILSIRK